jgi:hypothetical protein
MMKRHILRNTKIHPEGIRIKDAQWITWPGGEYGVGPPGDESRLNKPLGYEAR